MKHITSGRIASALIAATLLTSPMAMASDHGEHHRGKHDKAEMCENMREGKGWFNDEKRQAKWAEHRNDMADRLKLTDEQREIWDEIHEERREKHSAKMEKRQKKMESAAKTWKTALPSSDHRPGSDVWYWVNHGEAPTMPEPGTAELTIRPVQSIDDIHPQDWNGFVGRYNPFLQHEFLLALEESGCTNTATGWQPAHLAFYLDNRLAGVAPAYLKAHSMGEYVFDWAWADAYQRYGMDYYPKLLIAIPFTPCQGPRLLFSETLRQWMTPARIHDALDAITTRLGAHSWHLLFPDRQDQVLLDRNDQLHRIGCQFHWHNHEYNTFEDFLARLTSRKRKSIRKERRQVADQGISFRHFSGDDIPDNVLAAFHVFYQATYLKRGQQPYLNKAFFRLLKDRQAEHLHLVMAVKEGEMIAGALFLTGEDTLYGRYWGCLEEFDHLHFETCYYQGIELAIQLGLARFDAGAQGEHKLVRGFEPVITHSWHGVMHPGFRDAIERFTSEEAEHVMAYTEDALQALPFRQTEQNQ